MIDVLAALTVADPSHPEGEPVAISYRELAGWLAGREVQGRWVYRVLAELVAAKVLDRVPGAGTRPDGWRVSGDFPRWRVPWMVDRRIVEALPRPTARHKGGLVPRSYSAAQGPLVPRSHGAALDELVPRSRARHNGELAPRYGSAALANGGGAGGYIPNSSKDSSSYDEDDEALRKRMETLETAIARAKGLRLWGSPHAELWKVAARANGHLPELLRAIPTCAATSPTALVEVLARIVDRPPPEPPAPARPPEPAADALSHEENAERVRALRGVTVPSPPTGNLGGDGDDQSPVSAQ